MHNKKKKKCFCLDLGINHNQLNDFFSVKKKRFLSICMLCIRKYLLPSSCHHFIKYFVMIFIFGFILFHFFSLRTMENKNYIAYKCEFFSIRCLLFFDPMFLIFQQNCTFFCCCCCCFDCTKF